MAFVELFGEKLLSKEGDVNTADVVAGKTNILVYFSAHWCPPCRSFTPQLAQAYKDSSKAGKETAVIFVSSDRDEAGFDGYYGEMPWHALPYSQRDLKGTLSEKFGVNGIPMLIVLDAEGKLVSENGRSEYKTYLPVGGPAGTPAGVANDALVALFGDKLVGKDGNVQTKDVVAGKTHIMIYFSAHWCPPCRAFTPMFAKAYKDSPKAGKDVAVIFASSDRDQASFDEYYGEMPWHALPFSESAIKEKLSAKFEVNGIPMLIILDAKGNLVTSEGRSEYKKYLAGGVKSAACCVIS